MKLSAREDAWIKKMLAERKGNPAERQDMCNSIRLFIESLEIFRKQSTLFRMANTTKECLKHRWNLYLASHARNLPKDCIDSVKHSWLKTAAQWRLEQDAADEAERERMLRKKKRSL